MTCDALKVLFAVEAAVVFWLLVIAATFAACRLWDKIRKRG